MATAEGNPPCFRSMCSCYLLHICSYISFVIGALEMFYDDDDDDAYCVKSCNVIEMNVIL